MEKLIELVNQYEKEISQIPVLWTYNNGIIQYGGFVPQISKTYLISKHYGFIEWLVDNDKIDYHNKINYNISLTIHWKEKKTTREERLLMMLSIQDEPISFLIDLLK